MKSKKISIGHRRLMQFVVEGKDENRRIIKSLGGLYGKTIVSGDLNPMSHSMTSIRPLKDTGKCPGGMIVADKDERES